MAYCTECGKRLPDSAVFCPNCGQRCQSADDISNSSTYSGSEQASDGASSDQSYYEAENKQQDYKQRSSILDSDIYKGGSCNCDKPDNKDSRAAVIVICSVLFLILIAVAVFFTFREEAVDYTGYWQSTGVDIGDGQAYPDLYGQSINGFIEIQIEQDGVIKLISEYTNNLMSGIWRETDDGIRAEINDDIIYFDYEDDDDSLILSDSSGYGIIFHRAHGNINGEGVPAWSNDNIALEDGTASGTVAGSGYVGNEQYHISVVGAEQFSNVDGKAAARIYFEFTNNSDYTISAYNALGYYAKQDGNELSETYSWDDVEVYSNIKRSVRPGITIQCCYEFTYNPDGGAIDFVLYDYELGTSAGTVAATYVPGELPGSPAPFMAKFVEKPQWTLSIPAEGTVDNLYYVAVVKAELLDDYYGDPAIRIYYEFSNNSGKAVALGDVLNATAYQDGIALSSDYPTVNLDSDENFYKVISSGEKITASFVFLLRNSSSPVEAEIESFNTYDAVGQTYVIS